MSITRTITGDEPVSLVDMKAYLRVTHDTDDGLIRQLISIARAELERYTGLSLVEQEIELEVVIDGTYRLPYGPVTDVTVCTVNDEDVDVFDGTVTGVGELIAEYTAGPYDCNLALMEFVAHLYFNRGSETMPAITKRWVQNNTLNLWLQ